MTNDKCLHAKGYFDSQKERICKVKDDIARYAASKYISPGDSIVIDAGTSLAPIAKFLEKRGSEQKCLSLNYSIMTHNSEAFDILKEKSIKYSSLIVFLAGGRYVDDLKAFFGDHTCKSYQSFGPQKVFIGASALSAGGGLRCQGNTEEIQVKKLIIQLPTQHRIIISDFTKFGRYDALQFASTYELKVASDGYAVGDFIKNVNVTIVTNRPNLKDYCEHCKYLIKMGANEGQIIPFDTQCNIYEHEKEAFSKLEIAVDEIPNL